MLIAVAQAALRQRDSLRQARSPYDGSATAHCVARDRRGGGHARLPCTTAGPPLALPNFDYERKARRYDELCSLPCNAAARNRSYKVMRACPYLQYTPQYSPLHQFHVNTSLCQVLPAWTSCLCIALQAK